MTWGIFKEDSVSEAYKKMKAEELKGNQHKLDKNKNGKIDADDFKKLRGEETEDASLVDEASNPHATNDRVYSTSTGTVHRAKAGAYGGYKKDKEEVKLKSPKSLDRMDKTLAKDMDEAMSKADTPTYLRKKMGDKPLTMADVKAAPKDSISHPDNLAKARGEDHPVPSQRPSAPPGAKSVSIKMKEEAEQIDELSIDTLKSYANKARQALSPARDERQSARAAGDYKTALTANKKVNKLTSGIKQAKAKLNKEEVEELDEISLDTMKSAKDKLKDRAFQAHMDDNKYGAQHYAGRAVSMASKIKQKEKSTKESLDEEIAELEFDLLKESDNEDHVTSRVHKIEVNPDGFTRRDYGDHVKTNHGVKTNFHGKPEYDKKQDREFHHVSYTGPKKNVTAALKAHRENNRDNAEYLRQTRNESLDIFSAREIDSLINEVLKASDGAGKWISDFVQSDDPRFTGDSKEQRKKRALAAYYAAHKKESVDYDSFLEEATQGEIVKSGSKEIKHANVKDKEDDQEIMEPHSKGEQDFLDQHTVAVTDDPGTEYKSGSDKLAVAAKPTATGAGVYKADTKLSDKDKASVKESTSKKNCTEEDDSSCETGKKASGKSTYNTFKEKMNDKKGC